MRPAVRLFLAAAALSGRSLLVEDRDHVALWRLPRPEPGGG